MRKWWIPIVIPVVASVLSAFAGNIATVVGPSFLSYGTLPRFVKDPIYKKLEREFPELGNRLDNIFLYTDCFYKQRTYELVFVRIRQGKLLQRRKVTTLIYNPFGNDSEVDVSPRLSPDTVLISMIVKDEHGKRLLHQVKGQDTSQSLFDNRTVQLSHFIIESGKIYTMETELESEVPLSSREAFVTQKTVLGFYEMKINIDQSLRNSLEVSTESLSYECLPESSPISDGTCQLKGPIFPGGGFLVEWNYQEKSGR